MRQDEIIERARRARLHRNRHNLASNPVQYKSSYDGTEEALIAFAKLVAEKSRLIELVEHDIGWELRKAVTDAIYARDEA